MNRERLEAPCQEGRAFQDRRKQGCLREAPMDGFTAFLKGPPFLARRRAPQLPNVHE
jgi:hypothetical protein